MENNKDTEQAKGQADLKNKFVVFTPEDWTLIMNYIKVSAVANWDNAEKLLALKQAVLRGRVMNLDVKETKEE